MSKQFPYPNTPIIIGAEPHDNTGDNMLGIRTNDATQRYIYGTRAMGWDGSVYRYYNAGNASSSYQAGIYFNDTGDVTYESAGAASPAGSHEITIAETSITEDQFAGGYIILFHATGNGQLHSIRGNTATSGSNFIAYVEEPLAVAVTTSDALEVYLSPYADLRSGTSTARAWAGIPQAIMTSGYNGWVKTWGPTFISPQATVGVNYVQAGYWRNDGSIDARGNVGTNVFDQRAGHTLIGSATGNGPLFLLQGNI